MQRTTLVLLIVLGVVVIGGGVYFVIFRDRIQERFGRSANTASIESTETIAEIPASHQNLNLELPEEVKGDMSLDATMTVGQTKLHLSSAQYFNKFNDLTAGASKVLIVVYFDAIPSDQVTPVVQSIAVDTKVEHAGGTADLRRYKVASSQVKNDRGFLLFEIPSVPKTLILVRGSGTSQERVPLPLPR